ncbi:MAG: IS66 family transposase [Bacteroides thetaiotaomicron]
MPIYKGLPGASLLTEILLQKYEYHVPFYRRVREFHHLGLEDLGKHASGVVQTCL